MARGLKAGDVAVVVSLYPNAVPAANTDDAPDLFGTVHVAWPTVIASEARLRAWPKDAGRFYEAECKGMAADGRTLFHPMRRLRITTIDDRELGATAAPGIAEVAAFLRGDEPSIREPEAPPPPRR